MSSNVPQVPPGSVTSAPAAKTPAQQNGGPDHATTELRPFFYWKTFVGAVLASLAVSACIVWIWVRPLSAMTDSISTLPSGSVGLALAVPVLLVGIALCATGAALAVTEWRGTLKKPDSLPELQTKGADPTKIIDAIGKLRGSPLLIVSGMVLLLGVCWIGASASGASETSTPPGAPPSPSASASTSG